MSEEDIPDGYTYDIPEVSDNTVDVEAPATFLEGANETNPPQDTKDDSVLNHTVTEMDAEDELYLQLVSTYSSFADLSEEHKAFFCSYTGCSEEEMLLLNAAGASLADSETYSKLSAELELPLQTVLNVNPELDDYFNILAENRRYLEKIRSSVLGTELDTTFCCYLLQGYTYEQIMNAYGVSSTFGIGMDALLNEESGNLQVVQSSELTPDE